MGQSHELSSSSVLLYLLLSLILSLQTGGFHHASAGSGGGFCPLADLTLSIRMLQRDYPDRVKNVMLIDLDAHQGNGHERDFLKDDSVFIVDFYNSQIYPGDEFAKKGISMNVPLKRSMHNDTKYLPLLKQKLEESFDRFKPDIIYYNAGTDCMEGDPLGDMDLTPDGIVQRDEIVFDAAFSRKLPIVMVLSGGYQKSNAFVIALSIANLKKKFKLWTRAGEEKQEERRSRSPSGKSSKKRKSKKKTR